MIEKFVNGKTEVWSCGGGTQSGAIAVLIAQGRLPKPDIAFMTDTGRERSSTWPFVNDFIRPQLAKVGLDLTIVKASQFARLDVFWDNTILIPGYTTQNGGTGKLSPFCSGKWKRDVCERYLRSIGVEKCRNWIGISLDEVRRVRSQHRPWLELWYPLIFLVRMTRQGCIDLIVSEGYTGVIPHSACYMCPNLADSEWIDMKLNWPEDFRMACELESEVRLKDKHFFLHPSCVPLAEVDFFRQGTMFSERGCTGGCFT